MMRDRIEDVYPLTAAQRLFCVAGAIRAGGDTAQFRYEFAGPLDTDAFESAWRSVIARHAVLRTGFMLEGVREPVQVVLKDAPFGVTWPDSAEVPAASEDSSFAAWLESDQRRGFVLTEPPLMRVAAFRRATNVTEVVWTLHRALLDGWSAARVLREVGAFYQAAVGTGPFVLDPTRQYRDYIGWLQRQDAAAAERYWRGMLFSVAEMRSRVSSHPGSADVVDATSQLDATATRALSSSARASGVTLNTLLFGACASLVSRLTQQREIVVGATFNGRPSTLNGVENICGLFTSNLPVALTVDPAQPGSTWLRSIQERVLELREHEWVSQEQLQQWAGLPTHRRLFDVLVVLQDVSSSVSDCFGTAVTLRELGKPFRSAYPITLVVAPGEQLKVWISADPARLNGADVQTVVDEFIRMLETAGNGVEALLKSSALPIARRGEQAAPAVRSVRTDSPVAKASQTRDPLEQQLAAIWERIPGISPVPLERSFFELGGHSLLAVEMFADIERTFSRSLPLATLLHADSVSALANVIRGDDWKPAWRSLVPLQPAGANPPLFCVHAGGGNVLFYRDLARRLGTNQPFYALQPVGLDRRQAPHQTIEEMAVHYINEMRSLQPRGPYYLAGSSFGGTVAYEMACQLRAAGEEVALLALFDTYGPGYPKRLPRSAWRVIRVRNFAQRVEQHVGSLWLLDRQRRVDYVVEKTRKARVRLIRSIRRHRRTLENMMTSPEDRIPQPLRDLQAILEQAHRAYEPTPYSGRITLFRATRQPVGVYPDRSMGWGGLALGGLDIHDVSGFHGTIVAEPRVQFLVAALAPYLRQETASGDGAMVLTARVPAALSGSSR